MPGPDDSSTHWYRPNDNKHSEKISGAYNTTAEGQPWARFTEHPAGADLGLHDTYPAIKVLRGESRNQAITLLSLYRVGGSDSWFSGHTQFYARSKYALLGEFWPSDHDGQEVRVNKLQVQPRGIHWWADWQGWQHESTPTSSSGPGSMNFNTTFHGGAVEPIRWRAQGADISLHRNTTFSTNGFTAELKSEPYFRIELDVEAPLDDAVRLWAEPLRSLMVFACGYRSGYSSLRVRNSNWFGEGDGERPNDPFLDVALRSGLPYTSEEFESRSAAFCKLRLSDVEARTDFFEQLYLQSRRHSAAYNQYVSVRERDPSDGSQRFLDLIRAVEGLARGIFPENATSDQVDWARIVRSVMRSPILRAPRAYTSAAAYAIKNSHRTSLETKLRQLDKLSGMIVSGIVADNRWAASVARLRNIQAHQLSTDIESTFDKRAAAAGFEVISILFELVWLIDLGFSSEQAIEALSRDIDYWRRKEAVNIFGPLLLKLGETST